MVKPSKNVQDWFKKSREDLLAANVLSEARDKQLWGSVTFHCQQAAEKAMKGFLTHNKKKFRKTHNLLELGAEVTKINSTFEPLMRKAIKLNPYAVIFRYPDASDIEFTNKDVEEAIWTAKEVVNTLSGHIG